MTVPNVDRAEVLRTFALFYRPGEVLEVRALGVLGARFNGRPEAREVSTAYGYFNAPDLAAQAVGRVLGEATFKGAYLTLNPCLPALLARASNVIRAARAKEPTTSDHDVRGFARLLVDCDPRRPAGISSSDEEKESARLVALAVRDFLGARRWPAPVLADSGNGYHLVYRIDLPVKEKDLVKKVLETLSSRFSTEAVSVDTTVANPARIVKLYGTAARKGDDVPDRPHRMSRILEVPDEWQTVSGEKLRELAQETPASKAPLPEPVPVGSFDLDTFVSAHFPDADPQAWNGGTRWPLAACPFNPDHTGGSAAILRSVSGVISFKCQHAGCVDRRWADVRALLAPKPIRIVSASQPAGSTPEPWPPLTPFASPITLPEFPVEALPEPLRSFVIESSASIDVPLDMPAMISLAVLATAGQRHFVVQVGDTHTEPLALDVAVVAEPGERKSETFRRVALPLEEIEEELVSEATPEIDRATARRKIQEERLAVLGKRAAKADNEEEREGAAKEAEDLAADMVKVPVPPRLIIADETPEHIATVLAQQGGRIAMLDPDSGLFDILAGRYSEKANIENVLKAHAGDTIRVGRGTREELVKRPALTIGILVQPSVVQGLAGERGFRGRGLLGRFLWSFPESRVGLRVYRNRAMPANVAAAYRDAIRDVFHLPAADPSVLALETGSPALAEWELVANRFEREQAEGGRLRPIRDWASKAAGAVARLTGLFHLVRHRRGSPASIPIDPEDVLSAAAVLEYATEHALFAFDQMGADERLLGAKKVLAWIRRNVEPEGTFRLRDLHQHHRDVPSPDALLDPLGILEARGYIRQLTPPERRGPGRPPSPTFKRSPLDTEITEVTEPEDRKAGAL